MSFLFPGQQNAAALVDQLCRQGWWGEIVGPHGSGKSTLVAALRKAIENAGRQVLSIDLHDGQRRLPLDLRTVPGADGSTVVILDGYEQLSRFGRWKLKRFCRRRRWGLLVTAHTTMGLRPLYQTGTDLASAERVVEQLLEGYPRSITRQQIAEQFERHGGDLREMLFGLYDLYGQRD